MDDSAYVLQYILKVKEKKQRETVTEDALRKTDIVFLASVNDELSNLCFKYCQILKDL